MNNISQKAFKYFVCAIALLAMSGCTPKNIALLESASDGSVLKVMSEVNSIKIAKGDKVQIIVNSKDNTLSDLFNLDVNKRIKSRTDLVGGSNRVDVQDTEGFSVYTVDPEGNIDFPILGTLHIAGMTRAELAGFIKGEIMGRDLIKDPHVTVEFNNTGISVLGEVNRPGRILLNVDQLNLLDAIALAGDLNIQGRRDNVLILRPQSDGSLKSYRVNLTDAKNVMSSPVYYLQQNDIIYVEPNDMKKRSTTVNGNTALQASFWVSVASLLTSVAVLIFK